MPPASTPTRQLRPCSLNSGMDSFSKSRFYPFNC
ncbi:hypothetical protein SLEP1_g44778 [Rubroshorea leprosula]|uniref:Uncharacterized protein n=1 Tax=Rubroshorea leprosula TaxID=152421 RepID=A0AAV5LJD9_9ROSI|nr:hypothetical protein SLEP1_g44778 [Rubroshorea leprosula]